MYQNYTSLRETIHKEIDNQKSVLNKFPEHISRPITQSCSKYLAQFTSHQLPFKSEKDLTGPASQHRQSVSNSSNQSTNFNNLTNTPNPANVNSNNSANLHSSTYQNSPVSINSVQNTVGSQSNSGQASSNDNTDKGNIIQLDSQEQVNWTLENLMYGLTLSNDYQDIIKDCWYVYHDWLSVLLDEPKAFVPLPIREEPIIYSRKMLWHLYHLFVPRKESTATTKHIMMCHGVLVLIENITKDSKLLQRDLWEDILKFFLAINDVVLSPPSIKDDYGDILSSRIVATLFEIWLIACGKVFPSASLWKTFQEFCSNWRHHISLVVEWNRVCFALTNRLLEFTFANDANPHSQTVKNVQSNDTNVSYDFQSIINVMDAETVSQTWFRFLHIIGKPIDFCDAAAISKSLEFSRMTRQKEMDNISNVANYTCIKRLPIIFLEVIKGVSKIVDSFLGISTNLAPNVHSSPVNQQAINKTSSSTLQNLPDLKARSKSVLASTITDTKPKLNPYKNNRPSVNSLLHLFGQWLFEAAIKYIPDKNETIQTENVQKYNNLNNRDYILGQAEAYGILCKLFCSVKTNENILPDYLNRFYALLLIGLKVPANLGDLNTNMEYESGEILASIIVNGYNIFKSDLEGVNVVLMPMLNALNAVFNLKYQQKEDQKSESKQKEIVRTAFNIGSSSVSLIELKRYCIYIFSSLICLPNHFSTLIINDQNAVNFTFYSLRSKILEIFLAAMTNEQDTINLQMLFGCGRLIVGEWSWDEINKKSNDSNMPEAHDKKEKASYCYNQIASLICAPLKINNSTLQNHSFALSIFDSLACLAADDILNEDESVVKIAISWIWHYVKSQIKRRSRDHTKEMHSVIVAAYNCLIMLLVKRPNLLKDKNCLQTVTNCIEIGISGSSSYPEQKLREDNKENTSALMKADKELKPASLRVKEAAECVLCFLMEHTPFSNGGGYSDLADSSRVSLDEKYLLDMTLIKNANNKFKYYAIDGSLIMGILEKPISKSQSSNVCPTISIILRGPFGRHTWSLNFRNSPFDDLGNTNELRLNNTQEQSNSKYYPNRSTIRADNTKIENNNNLHNINKATPKCETSIPSLSDVASRCVKNLSKFQKLKEEQIEFENNSIDRVMQENSINKPNQNDKFLQVKTCQEFQSARMLLSHLGYCSSESSTKIIKEDITEIIAIDSNDPLYYDQISNLDNLPTRTFSTGYIFYVKKNQSDAKEIINNMNSSAKLDESFYLFVQSIGSIVDISNAKTNSTEPQNETKFCKKLNKINGWENVIYWADLMNEVSFILPSQNEIKNDEANSNNNNNNNNVDEVFKIKNQNLPNDVKVLIVWLEQFQDIDNVPIDDLLLETYDNNNAIKPKEIIVIFIHPLKSKLFRIITWNSTNKKYFYTMPLVDGMIVSNRMLSSMVRQTVLNIFRRKRLEIDDYQPPHVKRKNKITEIIKKFQTKKSESDFFTSLVMGF